MKVAGNAQKIVGAIFVLAVLTATAVAQCGNLGQAEKGTLHRQAWRSGEGTPTLRFVDEANDPITGLWQVTLSAGGNVIDHGFAQWHADGTEIMNSGRPAITGNFCLGTWKVADGHYTLNHYAISWDDTGLNPTGLVNIRETVTLRPNKDQFSGSFSITQYDVSGTAVGGVSGQITGNRVKVNSQLNTY